MAAFLCRNCASLFSKGGLKYEVLNRFPTSLGDISPIYIPCVGYAKKAAKGGAKGAKAERLYDILEVNTDPKYLATHCAGSNFLKEGTDVKLKADEEYPDWLWSLNTGKAKPLDELDQDTPQYWRRLRKMHMKRNNRLAKGKKF
nr:39S ribosomal protein L54, mitochondrial-like [Lytechinus pictus]